LKKSASAAKSRAASPGASAPAREPARSTAPKQKKKQAARQAREDFAAQARAKMEVADPLSRANLRKLGIRIGIPVAIGWAIAFAIPGWIPKAVAGALTLLLAGVLGWAWRWARKSKAVVDIVRSAEDAESRKEALGKLDAEFKRGDVSASFAKAQLQLQEDPRAALATLESINLGKLMPQVADEARSQRAMIHLMLGDIDQARALADQVDLARHKEPKSRAALATIVGEAWARSGQARKAAELLETIDGNDPIYADVKPQLFRSLAFAYAWSNQTSLMKKQLRKLGSLNPQLLSGFITKKKNPMGVSPKGVHPLLEQEAYSMLLRSGAVQRKMQVKRM
jgi:hypothetical protein